MATKFYLHRGTTADTGTLPAAGASVSLDTSTDFQSGVDTNRNMDTTIGASAQTSLATTTSNNQSAQPRLLGRWLSAPIAAQTIASTQQVTLGLAVSESNTNSNFNVWATIAIWRPSTGAVVSRMLDHAGGTITSSSTSEVWATVIWGSGAPLSSVTSQDADIIVVELWRNSTAQGMSTAYTNTIFYDGTTEASSTNAAAYLNFANTITFFSGGTTYTKAGFGAEHA